MKIQTIVQVERNMYPSDFWMMQDCKSLHDIAEYCEVSVKNLTLLGSDTWYCLIGNHKDFIEIADLAGKDINIFEIVRKVRSFKKKVIMDCRESTSLPIVLKLLERSRIQYSIETYGEMSHIEFKA